MFDFHRFMLYNIQQCIAYTETKCYFYTRIKIINSFT